MATAVAMVRSGTGVDTTINRRRTPQGTHMASWCERILPQRSLALFLGFLLQKWPLFNQKRQLQRPPTQLWPFGHEHSLLLDNLTLFMIHGDIRWGGYHSIHPEPSAWPTYAGTVITTQILHRWWEDEVNINNWMVKQTWRWLQDILELWIQWRLVSVWCSSIDNLAMLW